LGHTCQEGPRAKLSLASDKLSPAVDDYSSSSYCIASYKLSTVLVLSSASARGISYWKRSAQHEMWLGQGGALLGLPPGSPVEPGTLKDLLAGNSPGGQPLTARPRLRRRQGWDLVFAAPKSVSLLAAGAPGPLGAAVREAHRQAVADAFATMEGSACWVSAGGRRERALAVVAAAFDHQESDAGQPHIHTHVVVPNLALRPDGRWGCLAGAELWRWREGLGASFQLALRARLAQAGFAFDWELGPGGLWEVSGVGAKDLAAASSRSLAARAAATWFGSGSRGAQRVAQATSRSRPRPAGGTPELSSVVAAASHLPCAGVPPPPPSPYAVERSLAERASSYSPPDLLVALAETSPRGLLPADAEQFRKTFSPTGLASHFDREVQTAALVGRSAHMAAVAPAVARLELAALGFSQPTSEVALRLACCGFGVEVLPRAPWLAQAACVDAARAVWQAAGMSVAVACPTEAGERRWRALTSLRPAGSPELSAPSVLVVDAADRLGPAKLARLVSQCARAGTKLVLVPGGTVPPLGESMARCLDDLIACSPTFLVDGTEPSSGAFGPEIYVPGLSARGTLTGTDALAHVVRAWSAAGGKDGPAVMVGLGRPEAEALNAAARASSGLAGSPAEIRFGSRLFAPGERVLALGRIGAARAGTRGTVAGTAGGVPSVLWDGHAGPVEVPRQDARRLGHAYATTPPYLRRCAPGARILVLGDPYSLPGLGGPTGWVTVPGPGMPAADPGLRWRAAVAELATGWPDEQILARAGPRPLNPQAHARWAELVASQAVQRALGAELHVARERGMSRGLSLGL